MIELMVKQFLEDKVAMPVLLERERLMTGEFLIIEKTGGSSRNHLKSATVAIQSYADSLYKAAELNELVKTTMQDIVEVDNIGGAHLNSDYNFTDAETKQYRYQAVYDINYC